MVRAQRLIVALSAALFTVVWAASMGNAAQEERDTKGGNWDTTRNTRREVFSPDVLQHGPNEGHLPSGSQNVNLVGKERVTTVDGSVSDVTYNNGFAYLGEWSAGRPPPDCTGGAWVVDATNPQNPNLTNFLPAATNSYYTEGGHAITINTPFFSGDILIESVESCEDADNPSKPGTGGGLDIWDVNDPSADRRLSRGFGDYSVGDVEVPANEANPHQYHSAFGWAVGNKAYIAAVDNEELLDVDIYDITNPRSPVKIAETGDSEWPGVEVDAFGDAPFSHDLTVKNINGDWHLMVSYWDAGWVDLNVNDPANPVFIDDSNYAECDQVIGPPACPPEGNAHQNEWNRNGNRFVGTDEDFSAFRLDFAITTGPHAASYDAGEFSWTVPLTDLPDRSMNGPTIFGGYACPDDRGGIPTAAEAMQTHGITLAEGEELTLVTQRGPVQDPNSPGDACFFSEKVETAQLLGYDAAIVANHHSGAGAGTDPDAFLCGSQGHEFTPTIPGVCVGHRQMHFLFDDPTNAEQTYPPDYTLPYPVGDPGDVEPDVGDVGWDIAATAEFDGWGYARFHNANTLIELDQYAIPAVSNPARAQGFGDLTVHEVAMEKALRYQDLAYFSWYSGGFRVAQFTTDSIQQRGWFIDKGGNNFWGVELCGFDGQGRRMICASDRDFGLYIFRYTGPGS
jgi:hypothetical protein